LLLEFVKWNDHDTVTECPLHMRIANFIQHNPTKSNPFHRWYPSVRISQLENGWTEINEIFMDFMPCKTQPINNHERWYKNEIRSRSQPRIIDSPYLSRDTRVKIALLARPLLTPVARKLCRCKHGVSTSRTCLHSRTLLRIEIVCRSS
jgi:hypothetical protein